MSTGHNQHCWLGTSFVKSQYIHAYIHTSIHPSIHTYIHAYIHAPGCSWLLLDVPGVFLGAPGCSWVLLGAPGWSWLLLNCPGCCWVLLGAPGWSLVLLGATGWCWASPWAWVSSFYNLLGFFLLSICRVAGGKCSFKMQFFR